MKQLRRIGNYILILGILSLTVWSGISPIAENSVPGRASAVVSEEAFAVALSQGKLLSGASRTELTKALVRELISIAKVPVSIRAVQKRTGGSLGHEALTAAVQRRSSFLSGAASFVRLNFFTGSPLLRSRVISYIHDQDGKKAILV